MNRRRRTARQSSNVFTAFTQPQILELKEIFNMLDTTSDGNISANDLETFLDSIGAPLTKEEINNMMEDMGERFNFTLFLTTLCERLSNIDSENVIAGALKIFDPSESGCVVLSEVKEALLSEGSSPLTQNEWTLLEKQLKATNGKVQIKEISRAIRHCGLSPAE
ncbi:myosin regulatory light chain 12 [Nematocida sp. LUAm3]|nr:myosin regulatory light chain 12 [Nematocida sp. LUAm3]KAI5175331.1 myosin regulatory light chain 12 [Nematocida sp. LUAm2]KAI5177712.1 myosin regulatory light chain 12 [Nematocida sp. LUAm1]